MVNRTGEARIKPEFVREITSTEDIDNSEFPEDETANNFVCTTQCDTQNVSMLEPPQQKKKKGQNKCRGSTVPRIKDIDRLCPNFLKSEKCQFEANCKFSHNVKNYLDKRPPDISNSCINFITSGYCKYGIECRYGKEHLTADFKNIIDEEKHKKYLANLGNENALSKESMLAIRKKKYQFPRADCYLKSSSEGTHNFLVNNREKKKIDFSNKLYLAPLTTVGNLPFRRVCKNFGADITCGEMAMATNLLQGHQSEWALVKRHSSEDIFGVQLCGGYPDSMAKAVEMLNKECQIDFIDINMGCPIDLVFKKGEGSALMGRMKKLEEVVKGMVQVSDVPITIKMRTGIQENKSIAHKIIPLVKEWGVDLITLHGRSREQRYTKAADWDYINQCAKLSHPVPFFGNGDIFSYEDAIKRQENFGVDGLMIARGALIKPWIFTEIKEKRHWDISSQERFELLKCFTNYGLEHWGSDTKGVENTRRFLLEWLSFLYRYIPVGLLEVVPQKINERPPSYFGRNDLETLFASHKSCDWVKISEMLLGPVPDSFTFLPKHKANTYS
ncbi:tRNA-dihydrouridine(47) synthase [NAD(P)(+)]-like isoform X2 [Hydra vulgaris]|nr:tRNA-dihydrouridine(47) synthase [NAD(P)(+)]-like [Hydra vulgaris]